MDHHALILANVMEKYIGQYRVSHKIRMDGSRSYVAAHADILTGNTLIAVVTNI